VSAQLSPVIVSIQSLRLRTWLTDRPSRHFVSSVLCCSFRSPSLQHSTSPFRFCACAVEVMSGCCSPLPCAGAVPSSAVYACNSVFRNPCVVPLHLPFSEAFRCLVACHVASLFCSLASRLEFRCEQTHSQERAPVEAHSVCVAQVQAALERWGIRAEGGPEWGSSPDEAQRAELSRLFREWHRLAGALLEAVLWSAGHSCWAQVQVRCGLPHVAGQG
jgi:hypothetical protein